MTEQLKLEAGVKPGKSTTEFWMAVAAPLVGALLWFRSAEDPEAREFAQTLMVTALAAYPVSRGIAKAGPA